ncbi:ABC-2 family transporter protein [Rothia sp. CCM 9419]|uniref:ABC-2 family transporter protein n=1 Tax=Rothia sp. CCM 9419 TaxID=3402662 RepID=UPI003AE52587
MDSFSYPFIFTNVFIFSFSIELYIISILYYIFGYLIAFFVSVIVSILSFKIQKIDGVNELRDSVIALLGGSIIPLDFYPSYIQDVVKFMPFKYIYYEPTAILIGVNDYSGEGLLISGFWCLLLSLISLFLLKFLRKRIVFNGG